MQSMQGGYPPAPGFPPSYSPQAQLPQHSSYYSSNPPGPQHPGERFVPTPYSHRHLYNTNPSSIPYGGAYPQHLLTSHSPSSPLSMATPAAVHSGSPSPHDGDQTEAERIDIAEEKRRRNTAASCGCL
jgi:hypothetical protein